MKAHKSIILSGAAIFLMSASDLAKFYHPVPHRSADVATTTDPTFHPSSGDAKQDVSAMASAGYELIGYSAFNGKEAGEKGASKQAKKIGATDVVYLEKYTDTQTAGAISSASFSPWSAFGIVTPISVRRYDQLAMYFRKSPRQGLGIYPRGLDDEEKARIGSNKGMVIIAVTNGSPAFMADVLPGDIVTSIDGRPVWDDNSLKAAIEAAKNKSAEIAINRGGQTLTKSVTIPAGDWPN